MLAIYTLTSSSGSFSAHSTLGVYTKRPYIYFLIISFFFLLPLCTRFQHPFPIAIRDNVCDPPSFLSSHSIHSHIWRMSREVIMTDFIYFFFLHIYYMNFLRASIWNWMWMSERNHEWTSQARSVINCNFSIKSHTRAFIWAHKFLIVTITSRI